MHNFKEMKIWQKAKELAVETYKITNKIPTKEQFGIISQLERAAVSVPANIAEGSGRATRGEFLQFLGIARGSNFEVASQLTIAKGLGFSSSKNIDEVEALSNEAGRLLTLLIQSIRAKPESRHRNQQQQ